MELTSSIYIAGHKGLIGSAMVRRLRQTGYGNLLLAHHAELDLTKPDAVNGFFARHQPEYVILAAGRVGGIVENQTFPADFLNANLAIQLNVLQAAHRFGVQKLILFGSSCMYPRECPQPMAECMLLTGKPEPTSLAYAISKLAGLQLCLAYNQQYGEARFIPVIPNSAFGPNDNFDPTSGHVLSSLIRRFHEAKRTGANSITLWGTGAPRREFIHADDIAHACLMLLNRDTSRLSLPVNLGTGQDYTISELAQRIAMVVGYEGEIVWDTNKPDGAPRKLLDSTRLHDFGWHPTIDFDSGLRNTYQWYVEHAALLEACL
ncbi:GDP-L-fucose synthase [Chitinivorax sp. B]|uniref:GDP-L-fucose synthase family protein n=1 Tax=Chitinivorax sp. B TaxID=2502235 RepID=UPI0010FA4A24|nr:GDP-L-fucose synthase [Chitinivorax sp. B]